MRCKHEEIGSEQIRTGIGLESTELNSIAKACLRGQFFIRVTIGTASNQVQEGVRHSRTNCLKCRDQVVDTLAWMKAPNKGYGRTIENFSGWGLGTQPGRTDCSVQHNTKLRSFNPATFHIICYCFANRNDPVGQAHEDRASIKVVMHGG